MPNQNLKSAEEITDPQKINRVFQDVYNDMNSGLKNTVGKFLSSNTVYSADSKPDIQEGRFIVEKNDVNKRVLFKIDGTIFYANLTEL